MIEAPRGTLIHHYKVTEQGAMKWANLIVATGHNNLAMNRSVEQVPCISSTETNSRRDAQPVQAVVRAYDPCFSCSTHALGQVPLRIELVAADGAILDEIHN